jgi:hypothetical protein
MLDEKALFVAPLNRYLHVIAPRYSNKDMPQRQVIKIYLFQDSCIPVVITARNVKSSKIAC